MPGPLAILGALGSLAMLGVVGKDLWDSYNGLTETPQGEGGAYGALGSASALSSLTAARALSSAERDVWNMDRAYSKRPLGGDEYEREMMLQSLSSQYADSLRASIPQSPASQPSMLQLYLSGSGGM